MLLLDNNLIADPQIAHVLALWHIVNRSASSNEKQPFINSYWFLPLHAVAVAMERSCHRT